MDESSTLYRWLRTAFAWVFGPSILFDELCHVAAATALRVRIDWSSTQLLGFGAHVSYWSRGPLDRALISGAAPMGFLLTGITSWCYIQSLPDSGLGQLLGLDGASCLAWVAWYIALTSPLTLLANCAFARSVELERTDLQNCIAAFREWQQQGYGRRSLPHRARLPTLRELRATHPVNGPSIGSPP